MSRAGDCGGNDGGERHGHDEHRPKARSTKRRSSPPPKRRWPTSPRIRAEVAKVIFGQESVVENTLLAILSGGHALLVGVPGLAKTKLVTTLGTVLGLDANRIQFTPDLMPSDILGSEVMDQDETGRRSFRFVKGPIFAQLLMADEINRA